jgi:pilus assembly protein Flp/PilA
LAASFAALKVALISGYRFNRAFTRGAHTLVMPIKFRAFLRDESGATAIEYGLIATGIALGFLPVLAGLSTHLKTTFSAVSTALK